jgi:hypothetical protein
LSKSKGETLWKYVHGRLKADEAQHILHATWDFYRNWQIKIILREGVDAKTALVVAQSIEACAKALPPLDFCSARWQKPCLQAGAEGVRERAVGHAIACQGCVAGVS